MEYVDRSQWIRHYAEGRGFRPLGCSEQALLAAHTPPPDGGGQALEVGCGTGALSLYLASLGYEVDAVDFADSALARAQEERPDTAGVRWICSDVERDDPVDLREDGYDLVVLRLVVPFFSDRTRVLHALGERLRPGGALVVITPTADATPDARRGIALDEAEIALITDGWETCERRDAGGLAFLVLRGPCHRSIHAVERQGPPSGPAVSAALAVVTDAAGRVLLGYSRRGMAELPGGKTDGGESFEAAAVRELAEETGLVARAEDAHVVTMLADDSHGVPRLTAVVRITGWTGTLTNPEPDKFVRWEFHDLHALPCLGDVFTPAAQALDAVWPGIIPGLPPVHAYPLGTVQPPVPGEPAEAVRRRHAMADRVIAGGWAPSPAVQEALRSVPRHRFAPEQDLRSAYDGDLAVVTHRNEAGRATSSVSAAWLQADMIEGLDLEPGALVWEAGSGGYNAELLAQVVGPSGRVVSSDIDEYVVRRARRFLVEAGSGRVAVFRGDAALGVPAHLAPRGGFDAIVITYNCWDVAPPWRELLAEGGRLVLPLEIGGYTRAITFQRDGDVLVARRFTHCGFVPAQGAHARTTPVADLLGGQLQIRFEDGRPRPVDGLEVALRGPRCEVATGVTMGPGVYFGSLQLYAATTLPGFCRLTVAAGEDSSVAGIAAGSDAPALLGEGALAYLTHVRKRDGATSSEREWEWFVYAFGDQGPVLAERLKETVRSWDRDVRGQAEGAVPALTVYPTTTPAHCLPPGADVVDKAHCRMVVQWPGRDGPQPSPVERGEARVDSGEGQ
ncbi:methyltransferase, FxLD system [Streptomyces sp. NPDC050842]|uniref:methyltransferase, FxLD system n=1 Tax=Streptomyces sp. NPDC050842 TaxID=3365636 RepID=UPI0037A90ED6